MQKAVSLSPNELLRNTIKRGSVPKKARLCVLLSIRDIVHNAVLKLGQTLNAMNN